jgi:DNA adenine methylase
MTDPITPKPLADLVNVASVPQRSLFRYPGGKTWLVPRARLWLLSQPRTPKLLIEPFAGGGIIGLTAMFEGLAEHVIFVELDHMVAVVWKVLESGQGPALAQKIMDFDCTRPNVVALLATTPANDLEEAFQTIVMNRTTRGGIMAKGVGLIKTGENNKGIKSRWYPETLQKRILAIHEIRDRFTFIEGDGMAVMKAHIDEPDTVYFIDPPYTAGGKNAGNRLYGVPDLDHGHLFDLAKEAAGDVLLTYDNTSDVALLAKSRGLNTRTVAMKSTHHAEMTELLVGRDFAWLPANGNAAP